MDQILIRAGLTDNGERELETLSKWLLRGVLLQRTGAEVRSKEDFSRKRDNSMFIFLWMWQSRKWKKKKKDTVRNEFLEWFSWINERGGIQYTWQYYVWLWRVSLSRNIKEGWGGDGWCGSSLQTPHFFMKRKDGRHLRVRMGEVTEFEDREKRSEIVMWQTWGKKRLGTYRMISVSIKGPL